MRDDDYGEEFGTTPKDPLPDNHSYPSLFLLFSFLFPYLCPLSRRVFQNCSLTRIVPAITRDPFSPLNHHHHRRRRRRPRILFAHLVDFDVVAAAGESTHSAPRRTGSNITFLIYLSQKVSCSNCTAPWSTRSARLKADLYASWNAIISSFLAYIRRI